MNVDNLKPAWRRFRLAHAMRPMDQQELLLVLDRAEAMAHGNRATLALHAFVFVVLTICCQGG